MRFLYAGLFLERCKVSATMEFNDLDADEDFDLGEALGERPISEMSSDDLEEDDSLDDAEDEDDSLEDEPMDDDDPWDDDEAFLDDEMREEDEDETE